MNTADSQQPRDPRDPDRLLARGLRATTPEFETRFDDLRRRLANEPRPAGGMARLFGLVRARPAWSTAAAAAVVLTWLALGPRPRQGGATPVDETGWYVEALALDDSLRAALVLTDLEALETLSLMPVETSGGKS